MPKTVLITGSSRGIGRRTAELFSDKGWNVVATMRDVSDWEESPDNVLVTEIDVTKPGTISKSVEKGVERFGGIDVLVNNAGFGLHGEVDSFDEEDFTKQFDVNVFGVFRMVRACLETLRENNGCIVNVSSVVGRIGVSEYSYYSSSKFAVEGFSESLRYELDDVRVKVVEPGPTDTGFFDGGETPPSYAMDDPEKVAKKVYLCGKSQCGRLRYPVGFARLLLFCENTSLLKQVMYWFR